MDENVEVKTGRAEGRQAVNAHQEERDVSCKRSDYLEWPEYFMAICFLSAMRSKDPCTQVGACIVNDDRKVVGIGYNGMPLGCSDDLLPWCKDSKDALQRKYMYVCHAEMNAIMNKNCADVKGCTIYVALFPCNECAKIIIQSGIRKVVYVSDKHHQKTSTIASKRLLQMAGVECCQYVPPRRRIVIDFDVINWGKMSQVPDSPPREGAEPAASGGQPLVEAVRQDLSALLTDQRLPHVQQSAKHGLQGSQHAPEHRQNVFAKRGPEGGQRGTTEQEQQGNNGPAKDCQQPNTNGLHAASVDRENSASNH